MNSQVRQIKHFGSLILYAFMLAAHPTLGFTAPHKNSSERPQSSEIILDAVVAAVDEKPITLSELGARLTPPRKLSLQLITQDEEAKKALEALIFERILDAEATTKRVSVADHEIEDYVNEVAARNSLTRSDFESVLSREGKSIDWYRHQVRTDILRTKLSSSISRGGISVMDSEIDEYLKNAPSFKHEGPALKLRVISLAKNGASDEDFALRIRQTVTALDGGENFSEVAKRLSDGSNNNEGGLLGVVAEKDLSSEITELVTLLKPGSYSKPLMTPDGAQIFFVERRFGGADSEDDDEENETAKREEARSAIQKQKTEEKLSAYFATEIFKNHSVDRKF